MKTKNNSKRTSRILWYLTLLATKAVAVTMIVGSLWAPVQAQAPAPLYTRPSLWFGLAGGANLNFYDGSTQRLNADVISPVAFHSGLGVGLFAAPVLEYHKATSRWGVGLQVGYDSRRGKYNQEFSPCNCPRDLTTKVSYITVEPTLRFDIVKSKFFLFAGPRVAYNVRNQFVYKQGTNPAYPEQPAIADVEGELSAMNQVVFSGQIGAGYDIKLNSQENKHQWLLTPFLSYQPYFGQDPRNIETWTVSTLRGGVALKFGCGKLIPAETEAPVWEPTDPVINFSIYSPTNIAAERRVKEAFPLRNYVFFNEGSTEIPARYVTLSKAELKDFREDNVELYMPKDYSGRSGRQMIVYYNILNVIGDRMVKNPGTSVTLVGSSEKGAADGKAMATSIQRYWVNVWGIDASRIKVEGQTRPDKPSGEAGEYDDLLLDDNRRVTIESSSPLLLMEFEAGKSSTMRTVEINSVQANPQDSYVSFYNRGANTNFKSWSLELKDNTGKVQKYGPYYQERVSISGNTILGTSPEGDYTVTMVGKTMNGKEMRKTEKIHVIHSTPPTDIEIMRFSVIYEFDESKATPLYEQYLEKVIIPKVPAGGRVVIHGYTDIIGDETYNHDLSHDRAMDVKSIMERGLAKAGKSGVTFETYGYGEDQNASQFDNTYPEERFYNRTVVIDILPK